MLIVTGANGQLGRKVVDYLLKLVPPAQIGVSVRDVSQAADLAAQGVRVRAGDFDDPASLAHAFEGAERLLLVSSNAAATGGDPLAQHRAAIAAAKAAGVKRILYTSQMSSSATALFPPGRTHAATEQMLSESGLAWTSLRHGFYAASALMMNRAGFEAGRLVAPEDGPVAWTTHDDLAAADAVLLAGLATINGPTPPLTAAATLDLAAIAAIASDSLGRPVTREIIGDAEMREAALARGMPAAVVEISLGYYLAARAGDFAATSPLLEQLLGRPPQSMAAFLKENLTPT